MTTKKIRKKRQEFLKSISLISRQARCRACQWASRISISWSILRTQTLRQRYSTNYSLVLVFIRICFILLLLFFLICFVYQHIIPNRDKSKQIYFFFITLYPEILFQIFSSCQDEVFLAGQVERVGGGDDRERRPHQPRLPGQVFMILSVNKIEYLILLN